MKKFVLMALMAMGITFTTSAQEQPAQETKEKAKPTYEVIYTVRITDETKVIRPMFFIDRAGKQILNYDPEDPVVISNPDDYIPGDIKSSKKEGNTETITYKQGQDPYEYKVVYTINPKLTSKDDLSSQTMKLYVQGQENGAYKIMNYDQLPDEKKQSIESQRKYREQEAARKAGKATASKPAAEAKSAPADSSAPAEEPKSAQDKAKDGVKNLLNKGKNLIKKN